METSDPTPEAAPPTSKAPRRRWTRWAVDLGLALAVFAAISTWQGRDLVGSGEPAPDFVVQDLQGVSHSLSDYRGRKVLLFLWAPWCGVCKVVAPNVASIASSANGEELAVLSVALAYQSRADVERVAAEHGIPTPLLGSSGIEDDYRINAYPTLYVIDERGNIRRSVVGYTTWLGLKLRLL